MILNSGVTLVASVQGLWPGPDYPSASVGYSLPPGTSVTPIVEPLPPPQHYYPHQYEQPALAFPRAQHHYGGVKREEASTSAASYDYRVQRHTHLEAAADYPGIRQGRLLEATTDYPGYNNNKYLGRLGHAYPGYTEVPGYHYRPAPYQSLGYGDMVEASSYPGYPQDLYPRYPPPAHQNFNLNVNLGFPAAMPGAGGQYQAASTSLYPFPDPQQPPGLVPLKKRGRRRLGRRKVMNHSKKIFETDQKIFR